ncbi:hypothetical protein GCM10011571_01880 [Marinithermofilum abyssi]|uniref:DUF302 domain-containing protein n=1 Tax=Marinithermofilum abyssi TaxID=1571185 RepID=A0A8J2VGZ2_9BACL|nr:DUF302 domain-containing protein [Marinithermofilum abyssi]GGE04491.1 hypothetical protein GCM10011571_01880 [Marinithermofilum abyssi]
MFEHTVETDKSVDEAVRALEQSLANHKFGVLWKLDIPTKLMEKGIQLDQEYVVLEVCNPDVAKKVLSRNQKAGYFLPCKVVVYKEKETGKTHIGLTLPTALLALTGDEGLKPVAEDVEATMIRAIEEAK